VRTPDATWAAKAQDHELRVSNTRPMGGAAMETFMRHPIGLSRRDGKIAIGAILADPLLPSDPKATYPAKAIKTIRNGYDC
jgi:hypothetical protein